MDHNICVIIIEIYIVHRSNAKIFTSFDSLHLRERQYCSLLFGCYSL